MNYMIAATIGLLSAIAVVLLLQRDTVRMVVGMYVLWNATNLLIIGVAAVRGISAPIVDTAIAVNQPMTDPLVQAIVLTAIVITFGFIALLIGLTSWMSNRGNSIDTEEYRESRH